MYDARHVCYKGYNGFVAQQIHWIYCFACIWCSRTVVCSRHIRFGVKPKYCNSSRFTSTVGEPIINHRIHRVGSTTGKNNHSVVGCSPMEDAITEDALLSVTLSLSCICLFLRVVCPAMVSASSHSDSRDEDIKRALSSQHGAATWDSHVCGRGESVADIYIYIFLTFPQCTTWWSWHAQ